MKKLSLVVAAIALATTGAFAAGSAMDSFDVTVNFTGACSVQTAAADLAFTYTAFGAAQNKTTSTVFKCSRGLTPTFAFDDSSGSQSGSAAAALGSAISAEGVIQGVRYTLGGSTAKSATGTAASAGANGAGGSDGSADEYTVSITADIAADQAGSGSGASGSQTRVLTIAY
jgi:spore coat protein U-like protein